MRDLMRRLPAFLSLGLLILSTPGLSFARGRLDRQEFQTLSLRLSEQTGYFPTDNLVSNETSYLQVLPILRRLVRPRQAYIGVGPDQNFSYIAAVHPALAFILDIRRDALLEHLFFKALFEQSRDRGEYLSLLFAKPVPPDLDLGRGASAAQLAETFSRLPSSFDYFNQRFEEIWRYLRGRYPRLVREADYTPLYKIASSFYFDGLKIRYRLPQGRTFPVFPTYRRLMVETDGRGNLGHYLHSRASFDELKRMQQENRIIPVVGNFAGPKALARIGHYLKERGLAVGVFYLSNVEFYLFRDGLFQRYLANLRSLPLEEDSLLVRSHFNFWNRMGRHPATRDGYWVTSLAQRATRMLSLHAAAPYRDYWDLVTRDYLRLDSSGVP